MGLDFLDQFRVVGRSGATAILPIGRASLFRCYTAARHAENFAYRFQWSSPGSKGERAIRFLSDPIQRLLSGFRLPLSFPE